MHLSGLYYDVKQFVSMDTTVPTVYGSYILEYNCHIPWPQCSVHSGQTVVFLVYTTGIPLIFELAIVQTQFTYGHVQSRQ